MSRARVMLPVLLLIAVSAVVHHASAQQVQTPPPYYLMEESRSTIGEDSQGRSVVRLWFRAYEGPDYDLDELYKQELGDSYRDQLRVNGRPVEDLIAPPTRADADTTGMVFLLAIDVSGSMGHENYDRRMKVVNNAVMRFLQSQENNTAARFRLFPFGHDVPQDVRYEGLDQQPELWEGRYLRPQGAELSALMQGMFDINGFVRHRSDFRVDTALYGAIVGGANELSLRLNSDPDFAGARAVVIVLTDGKNDLTGRVDNQNSNLRLADVHDRLARPNTPNVYVIGFGDPENLPRREMEELAHRNKNASYFEVDDRGAAVAMLMNAYQEIFEVEGSFWFVEFAVPEKPIIHVGVGPTIYDSMLLLPSATRPGSRTIRLITFGVTALVLLLGFNIWYFTQPKIDDLGLDTDQAREEALGPEEEIPSVAASGVSVQEWRRRRAEEGGGADEER